LPVIFKLSHVYHFKSQKYKGKGKGKGKGHPSTGHESPQGK